jgi:hypothetical protein
MFIPIIKYCRTYISRPRYISVTAKIPLTPVCFGIGRAGGLGAPSKCKPRNRWAPASIRKHKNGRVNTPKRSAKGFLTERVTLDKSESFVKHHFTAAVLTAHFAREVEDRDSGHLTLNHLTVDLRSTNHRFGLTSNHDSSMRTSRRYGMRERPINCCDLASAPYNPVSVLWADRIPFP